jgi:tRNA threonylcarbamoyladenosine biosynthesis protein TsaE
VWHFDFYRFSDPREWEDAGFRDIFASSGLKLCEWSQNAAGVMPTPDLELALDVDDDAQRLVTLKALTPRGQELLA